MSTEPLRPADLVGEYAIVAGEKDGAPEPEGRLRGAVVRFTEDTVTVSDPSKHETYAAAYTLDPGRPHCGITMTATRAPNAGEVARGLVDRQGDTVRLIYALPGGEAPTLFRTADRQLMFVLKERAGT